MSTPSPVLIRLTRKNGTPKNDDTIRITALGSTSLRIVYTDGDAVCGGGSKSYTSILTDSSLSRYIGTLVRLLRADTDPFHCVQFSFPAFPSFMYEISRLHNPDVLCALRNAAQMTHEAWVAELPAAAEESDSSSDSSSESSESTDSQDTDDDMPPLISAEEARTPVRILRGRTIHLFP